ncbi:hypothetical protein [Candidatus Poriferisodalis sp.]|uniref:hypothetical protein n=1 Tax=Candidatus Poriferisodalis sp. TaxID=3101277 RepID=UPI003B527F2E
MPKRTLAALLALLVAASTLAVVAQPAAAHSQTTTKQRCSYDPFAGRQCWTETVTVAHTHTCATGMTGTYPNCYPAPSDNSQNTGDEEAKKRAEEARKAAEEEAKRKAEEEAKKKAEEEAKKKAETVTCTAGHHHFGNGCHIHGFTPPADQCGTGKTWAPHAGHTPIRLPACKTTATADPCGDYAEDLIDALNRPNADGTYNLPTTPAQCKRTVDLIDALKKLRKLQKTLENAEDAIAAKIIAALQAAQDAPTPGEAANQAAIALGRELANAWDASPAEAKAAIITVAATAGCAALALAVAKTTLATAGGATPAWVLWLASPTGKWVVGTTCEAAVAAAIVYVQRASDSDDSDENDENDVSDSGDENDGSYDPDSDGDGKISTSEMNEVARRHAAGELTDAERDRIKAQWKCDTGLRSYCQ